MRIERNTIIALIVLILSTVIMGLTYGDVFPISDENDKLTIYIIFFCPFLFSSIYTLMILRDYFIQIQVDLKSNNPNQTMGTDV
jgi:hypothetical protein